MSTKKTAICLVALLAAAGLSTAQVSPDEKYANQYNKIYKAYLREPYDVSNLLAMAMFYSDTANPMRDYPMAMRYAGEAESLYVAILEDRERYKEAKKLIKKNITIAVVRQTKQHVAVRALRELVNDDEMEEVQLDRYAEAFKDNPNALRIVESKRLLTRFRKTRQTNTLAAYRTFIESYGTTDEGEAAAKEMGALAYSLVENAKREADVDSLLDGYLDIETVRNAAMRKKSAIAYNALLENPTPDAYHDYLKKYPGSDGYSSVLAKLDEQLKYDFDHLHSARQYADFARKYPDNPLAEEAIERIKELIAEKRDMEALNIYLADFPLDVSYNDIYLKVFNWHTEEGNLAPVEMFAQRFPNFPYKMALQDALKAAEKYDSIDIPRNFEEREFSQWASKVYHLTGKKESFVALQRTLMGMIAAEQWKKALQRIDYFNLSFEDVCVDEVAELRQLLEKPSDSRLKPSSVVLPAYDMMHPVMHPDGKTLYFCRQIDGQYHIQSASPSAGKNGTIWRSTGDVAFNNIANSDIELYSLYDGGKKMLIGSNGDIMIAEQLSDDGSWTVTETLPEPVNDPQAHDFDAYMLPDGTGMLFASDRKGGYNLQPSYSFFHGDRAVASDIYFAPLYNGRWGKPVNLGFDINSPYMECSPVISDDLTTLYFITDSRGLGFGDIYIATRDNIDDWTSWSKPVNYGKEVNSGRNEKSISMASATNSLLINSNKGSHYGCYKAPLYHTINSDFTNVEIKAGEVGFSADIVDVATRKNVGHPINVKQQSAWTGLLRSNQQYLLYAHQQGLYMPAICFTPAKNAKPTPEVYSLSRLLAMADEERPLPLEGILFVDGQATLENCSMKELDHLADLLQRNTNVGIEVSCHVDAADDAASFRLSQERANRVKEELVARGIHPDRIATSPYGNSYTKRGLTNSSITITLLRL